MKISLMVPVYASAKYTTSTRLCHQCAGDLESDMVADDEWLSNVTSKNIVESMFEGES